MILLFRICVRLPLVILGMMLLAPIGVGCFAANLCNGELQRSWAAYADRRQSIRANHGLLYLVLSWPLQLRKAQLFCFTGPFIWAIFNVVYWIFYAISEMP